MAHRLLYIKFVQMLAVLLVFSSAVAHAVSMGEIAIKSHWGEPLRAQVDLHIDANEIVNESCLSVVMPDAQVEDASAYLTKISLEVKSLEDKPFALISTREPFNEMFAKVKLQIKCSSMASITKTFTILPEFDVVGSVSPAVVNVSAASVPQPPIVSADAVAAPSATEVVSVTQQKAKISTRPARVRGATPHQKIKSHTTSSLKVSGQLDAAAINSLSKINKDELLAKLKTLNSDDQIAAMLAMQYQIKQLSEELADIKLRISPASAVAPAVPQAASVVAAKAPALPVAPETSYRFWLLAACVVLIGLLVAVRFLNQKKKSVLASFETESNDSHVAPKSLQQTERLEPIEVAKPPKTAVLGELTQQLAAHVEAKQNISEVASIIEEAQLYALHGRPQKAIEILNELVHSHPSDDEAWLALLSTYANLRDASAFEKIALELKSKVVDDAIWAHVQELGLAFDPENSLYQPQVVTPPAAAVVAPAELSKAEDLVMPELNVEQPTTPVSNAADRFKPLEFDSDLNSNFPPIKKGG